jgi:hypothetical protein
MGAYNKLITDCACPFCGHQQPWTIQFQYGDCWQYDYKLGDVLQWGGNEKGENVGGYVRTDGITEESCQACGYDGVAAAIYFRDNVIVQVELLQEALNLQVYFEKL